MYGSPLATPLPYEALAAEPNRVLNLREESERLTGGASQTKPTLEASIRVLGGGANQTSLSVVIQSFHTFPV